MICHIVIHWADPTKIERIKAVFDHNTDASRNFPGLINRQILRSTSDPLKWSNVNIWKDEESLKRWMEDTNHIIDGYGKPMSGPKDSEYYKKYVNDGYFDTRPADSDVYEVYTFIEGPAASS